jgi:hypothetical protein
VETSTQRKRQSLYALRVLHLLGNRVHHAARIVEILQSSSQRPLRNGTVKAAVQIASPPTQLQQFLVLGGPAVGNEDRMDPLRVLALGRCQCRFVRVCVPTSVTTALADWCIATWS